jgi:peptide/nickel transport system permease protein
MIRTLHLTRSVPGRARVRRPSDRDWALLAGAAFFGCLILLAVYGPLLAPHDLYYQRALIDGKAPPFPPSAEFPLGSDSTGRDRLSWLLIGARGTVVIALAAAAIRVAIGASLGVLAGFRGGLLSAVLRRLALGLSSVPATIAALLAVIALNVTPLEFVLALGLIGWAEPFHQARRYARAESSRPYIESARSLGLRDRRLLLRHLLPNLAPALLTTAAFQVSAVFLLMAELALLNIFVGGAVVIDYDARGIAIVAPRIPNWASMLATTRPIVSLYGDLAAVLLPGGALLAAVLATNLFGDALAARAQRLDVFRLFSRRHVLALAAVGLVVGLSVVAWPNRLAAEIAYAHGFDGAQALAVARDLAALGPRTNGSSDAAEASALLANRMQGQVVQGTDTAERALVSDLSIAGIVLVPDAVTALSLDDADATGPLIYLDFTAVSTQAALAQIDLSGAIVVVGRVGSAALGNLGQRLRVAGAVAVVGLDPLSRSYPRAAGVYPLPTLLTTSIALSGALHQPLPDLQRTSARFAKLADEATVHIRTETVTTAVSDVVARLPARSAGAPLVLIAAPYDTAPGTTERWASASSTATLLAVLDQLRRAPVDLDIVAVATSADYQSYAGLRLAITRLSQEDSARLRAILLIGPVLSDDLVVGTQADIAVASSTGRLAARLGDALGLTTAPQASGDLLRAILSAGATASPITFAAAGPDRVPAQGDLRKAGEAVLAALAYVPRHLSER